MAPSEGTFIYLVGVVIVAARPGRFWLGFSLAVIPIVVGMVGKTVADRARRGQ